MDIETLTRLFRAYDTGVDADAVQAALQSGDAQTRPLAEWLTSHLSSDTLLSVDALAQFTALERSGQAAKLLAGPDMPEVLTFSDSDLKDAIEQLNRSTEAIGKQTETLKLQHDALDRLVRQTQEDVDARADLEMRQARGWEASRGTVMANVEDISQAVKARVSDLEQQGRGDGAGLRRMVDGVLHSDDRLLSSLQKLGWELHTEDAEETESVAKLRETCARLIKCTVEGARTRLDRIYLESLEASTGPAAKDGHGHASPDEISAMREELESLYTEILPVSQMSVEQQFLEPALKGLAAKNGQSLLWSEQAVDYMHECFDYLLGRTDKLVSRIEAFQGHQAAASTLVATAKAELAALVPLPSARVDTHAPNANANTSPTRRRSYIGPSTPRANSSNTSGYNAIATPLTRRRSRSASGFPLGGTAVAHSNPALDELLATLGIALPSSSSSSSAPTTAPTTAAHQAVLTLTGALADRRAKLDDVARSAQQSFEGAAIGRLADARAAADMARESLLAETPFGAGAGPELSDPGLEESIQLVMQEVEGARGMLAEVEGELDTAAGERGRRGRSTTGGGKREEMVRRWG